MRWIVVAVGLLPCACAGLSGLADYSVAPDVTPGAATKLPGTPGASSTPTPPGASASLTITPSVLAPGTAMLPYAQTLDAAGGEGPYTFTLAQGTLPEGLALSPDGALAGTPAAGSSTPLTIAAADAKGRSGQLSVTLEIAPPVAIPIETSDNVVLATLAGDKAASVGAFVFTINAGKIVGSTDATKPALTTGDFAAGSVVVVVNHGAIQGMGGAGGGSNTLTVGGAGAPGGPALSLAFPLRIDNVDGTIFGGGGGGGSTSTGWACGGGGGQGAHASSGGGMSHGGGAGGPDGPGAGGSTTNGMHAGAGGAWGAAGEDATSNSAVTGGKGGAGGDAVHANGKAITWVAGNDADHVKGAVTP